MTPDLNVKPLDDNDMARLMAALGSFEKNPHLSVAVSGGADSLAMTLLADAWARLNGGKVTALSVDHGLRPEAAAEVRQVAEWLSARSIDHHVLEWHGKKPVRGLQAAARDARYDLLERWCRDAGVLHLMLAHHQEDQAETFLLRLNKDSGVDGLAAMAAIVEKPGIRLLRPFLGTPKERLRATLRAQAQPWLEDPSNDNTAFERVRIRQSLPNLAEAGITPRALAETAGRMARARIALERTTSHLLAQCCSVDPAGYALINAASLFSGSEEISLRVLSRTLMCVGGGEYGPRMAKLERLHEKMKASHQDGDVDWKGATLGRCRVMSMMDTKGRVVFMICREGRSLPAPMPVQPSQTYQWDRRFSIRVKGRKDVQYQDVSLYPLGRKGWGSLIEEIPEIAATPIPEPVRMTLPALADRKGIIAVPHLNYRRSGLDKDVPGFETAIFHPKQSLSGAGFLVAD